MKTLDGLRTGWIANDNLQLGVIKACTEYLETDMSPAWLAGGTGTALAMMAGVEPGICNSYFMFDPPEDRAARLAAFGWRETAKGDRR